MLGFLRFIILLGLLAIGGAAVYAWSALPGFVTPPTVQLVEKTNAAAAQGYIGSVWKKYRDVIVPLTAGDTSQLKDHPEVLQFAQETAQYFQPLPLVRANIYTVNGVLLLTIDGAATDKLATIGASPHSTFVTTHLKAATFVSDLLEEVHITTGQTAMVQTVIPIRMAGSDTPEGAIEIITTMPDLPQVLAQYQQYAVGGMAAVSGVILLMVLMGLFMVVRKSETIITRQHEANAELLQAVAEAQAASRDKSQFLANVSHELRTPLNAIIGFSEILKNEVISQLPDKKYENYIIDINMSGVHLLSLINDILDYSKAEAGKLELEVSEINATKLVQNSLRLVSPRAESANVKLMETLPKEQFTMVTDSKKFKQVLLNLLSNAVKFTPPGGQVSVNAWHNVADDTMTFEVRDTGIGIAPKDISRAMMPFGQVDNTLKRKYEGTGLGLPLTKRFVELMGGKFTIESEVNKGTTITFTLPRVVTAREGVVVKQAV